MPVRSLSSFVFRWPDREEVDGAACRWAREAARGHDGVLAIGYFSSYAWGDAGVGSDLDIVVILESCPRPFIERARDWDESSLPFPRTFSSLPRRSGRERTAASGGCSKRRRSGSIDWENL
ncbi:MAG: nucleotidyltransferase domain-containing protein [Methanotrichaceae archaeon]|nr:nucleotidyltransferase domain-containing protein [Methanotrichaceae archaeon]